MAKQLFVRAAGAFGLLALVVFFLGIDPFVGAGAGVTGGTPAISVNRGLKGDRLPVSDPAVVFAPSWPNNFGAPPPLQPTAQTPYACDAAFSTIFVHSAANIYRRCIA